LQARYFICSADGGTTVSDERAEAAERAALKMGEGSFVVDTMAPVYVPMIQQVTEGELQILGVGGWGADRLSPEQNLVQAIKRKQVAIVHAFLEKGAASGTCDENGRPAISWAVASGRQEIVRLLLDKGADPTVADPQGITAVGLAAERGEAEIIAIFEQASN
jgi:hypothetical protein